MAGLEPLDAGKVGVDLEHGRRDHRGAPLSRHHQATLEPAEELRSLLREANGSLAAASALGGLAARRGLVVPFYRLLPSASLAIFHGGIWRAMAPTASFPFQEGA